MPTEEASARTLMIIVSVIGGIFAVVMVILFFNAAPARSNIPDHRTYIDAAGCLKCHLVGTETSPIMPHLNLGKCNLCHGLDKSEKKVGNSNSEERQPSQEANQPDRKESQPSQE